MVATHETCNGTNLAVEAAEGFGSHSKHSIGRQGSCLDGTSRLSTHPANPRGPFFWNVDMLEAVHDPNPHVLVIDLALPDVSGVEIALSLFGAGLCCPKMPG